MRKKFSTENVSLKKIQTVLHNPKQLKDKRRVMTAAVLVLMSVVILLGAIKIIDATQADKLNSPEPPQSEGIRMDKQETPCPKSRLSTCPLKSQP